MSGMTIGGRTYYATLVKAVIDNSSTSALIAVGTGESWWHKQQTEQQAFAVNDILPLDRPINIRPNEVVILRSQDGQTTHTKDIDFNVTDNGIARLEAGGIASGAIVNVTYTAAVPTAPDTDTELKNEVGRLRIGGAQYVELLSDDADPSIQFFQFGAERYVASPTPTPLIYMRGRLNELDGVGDPISESSLFLDCAVDPSLPEGQLFYSGAEITQTGVLTSVRTHYPFQHDGDSSFEVVVLFEA